MKAPRMGGMKPHRAAAPKKAAPMAPAAGPVSGALKSAGKSSLMPVKTDRGVFKGKGF